MLVISVSVPVNSGMLSLMITVMPSDVKRDVTSLTVKHGMQLTQLATAQLVNHGIQQLVRIFATQLTVNNGMLP